MTQTRINADKFFRGNEDCIRRKSAYFDTFCNLIPSDSEYAPILKEALYAEDELFLKRLREPERHGRSLMRGRHNG